MEQQKLYLLKNDIMKYVNDIDKRICEIQYLHYADEIQFKTELDMCEMFLNLIDKKIEEK